MDGVSTCSQNMSAGGSTIGAAMRAYGVPENRRTDRIARAHFKAGRTAAAAARDERLAYVVLMRFQHRATAKVPYLRR
jgi:hypothetical protein